MESINVARLRVACFQPLGECHGSGNASRRHALTKDSQNANHQNLHAGEGFRAPARGQPTNPLSELHRICRRRFVLSYAAMAGSSCMA